MPRVAAALAAAADPDPLLQGDVAAHALVKPLLHEHPFTMRRAAAAPPVIRTSSMYTATLVTIANIANKGNAHLQPAARLLLRCSPTCGPARLLLAAAAGPSPPLTPFCCRRRLVALVAMWLELASRLCCCVCAAAHSLLRRRSSYSCI